MIFTRSMHGGVMLTQQNNMKVIAVDYDCWRMITDEVKRTTPVENMRESFHKSRWKSDVKHVYMCERIKSVCFSNIIV